MKICHFQASLKTTDNCSRSNNESNTIIIRKKLLHIALYTALCVLTFGFPNLRWKELRPDTNYFCCNGYLLHHKISAEWNIRLSGSEIWVAAHIEHILHITVSVSLRASILLAHLDTWPCACTHVSQKPPIWFCLNENTLQKQRFASHLIDNSPRQIHVHSTLFLNTALT